MELLASTHWFGQRPHICRGVAINMDIGQLSMSSMAFAPTIGDNTTFVDA
jgi:hypothetical protein